MWQEIVDECLPCLGHTVQLVVNGSIDKQWAVIDILSVGRTKVSFVNLDKVYSKAPPHQGFALFEITQCISDIDQNEGQGLHTMTAEMLIFTPQDLHST